MAEQQLEGTKVSGLLVDRGHLRPRKAVGAVRMRPQVNLRDPFADQTGVLACADVVASVVLAAPPARRSRRAAWTFRRIRPLDSPL